MPSIIRLPAKWKVDHVIRMGICNKTILDSIELILIIIIFVLVLIDFCFDIEKLVAAFASAFSAMALR